MKKLVIAALATTTLFATPAMAASDTTVIYATVPAVCTIDAPANNGAINLSGSTAIGDVTAQCNDPQGFTFTLTSANGFKLQEVGNPTFYAYSLSITGLPGTISSNQSIDSNTYSANAALISPQTAAVTVNTSGPTGPAYAGTYQDTLTWTITGN